MFVENTHVVFSFLFCVSVMSCVYDVTSFHSNFFSLLLFHLFIYIINLFTIIIVII